MFSSTGTCLIAIRVLLYRNMFSSSGTEGVLEDFRVACDNVGVVASIHEDSMGFVKKKSRLFAALKS